MKKLIAVLLIISLLVVACGPSKVVEPTKTTGTTEGEVTGEISDVGDLDADLDLSELDSLDKELGEIDW